MAPRLTPVAKALQHHCKLALEGLPPDVAEPEGPFIDSQEQEAYDLLRILRPIKPPVVAPGTPITLLVTASNLRYNARNEANNGGFRYDANPVFSISTNAPTLKINTYSYNQSGFDLVAAAVWVAGVEKSNSIGSVANGTTGPSQFEVAIPGTGTRVVDVYGAGQQNTASLNDFTNYVSLVSVVVPAGYTGSIIPVQKQAECIVVFGDSTTQAGGHLDPSNSWPRYMNRTLRTGSDVYVTGHSAMVGGRFIETAEKRQAFLNEYKAIRSGYQKGICWYDSMVNDAYFNAFTPPQLQSFYTAFIQLFLADSTLANDVLYLKTAITRSSEGSNGLGYPLGAYRDSMANAVADASNVRVKLADGPAVARPVDLIDGTHQSLPGDIFTATRVNELLNATVGGSDLTAVSAKQAGRRLTLMSDSFSAVRYAVDGNPYQSENTFSYLTPGTHTIKAKLFSAPYTEVSSTVVVNQVLYGGDVVKNGLGWQTGNTSDPHAGWYTTQVDATTSWEFSFTNGFIIYQNRQENCPQIIISIDNGQENSISISGPGYTYNEVVVYTSPVFNDGQFHTVTVKPGSSAVMNIYAVEVF